MEITNSEIVFKRKQSNSQLIAYKVVEWSWYNRVQLNREKNERSLGFPSPRKATMPAANKNIVLEVNKLIVLELIGAFT